MRVIQRLVRMQASSSGGRRQRNGPSPAAAPAPRRWIATASGQLWIRQPELTNRHPSSRSSQKQKKCLRPRSVCVRHGCQRLAAEYRQSSTRGQHVGSPLQLRCERLAITTVRDLQRPGFQDLADSVNRFAVGSHQQRSHLAQTRILRQRVHGSLLSSRRYDDVRVEEREVLEITAELAKTPIAAAGKTAVDLLDHQLNPGIVEASHELAALILRSIVHHHDPPEGGRAAERLETGREVIGGVVAHHHGTNGHHTAPD